MIPSRRTVIRDISTAVDKFYHHGSPTGVSNKGFRPFEPARRRVHRQVLTTFCAVNAFEFSNNPLNAETLPNGAPDLKVTGIASDRQPARNTVSRKPQFTNMLPVDSCTNRKKCARVTRFQYLALLTRASQLFNKN